MGFIGQHTRLVTGCVASGRLFKLSELQFIQSYNVHLLRTYYTLCYDRYWELKGPRILWFSGDRRPTLAPVPKGGGCRGALQKRERTGDCWSREPVSLGAGLWEMPRSWLGTNMVEERVWHRPGGREALSGDSETVPLAPFSLHAVCAHH